MVRALRGRRRDRRPRAPKVFLEQPYPDDVATVPACKVCNGGAGRDEEYVACLIECAAKGSTAPERIRPAVRAALEHSPLLRTRIESASFGDSFRIEAERVDGYCSSSRAALALRLQQPAAG
jgi:hypothetical protein